MRPDFPIAGSPERTVWRSVVETAAGELFVLERIPSQTYSRKQQIARSLQQLNDLGINQLSVYIPDTHGEFMPLIDHGLWQLCPFITGVDLDRPTYVKDGWRGEEAAEFLILLYNISRNHLFSADTPSFSIVAYCRNLFAQIDERQPTVAARYFPFINHLESHFFPIHNDLPSGFCHGDYHPMNIIWGNHSIRAVIDWEFSGIKPEIYDLANLMGCLGMEDPNSLTGPFVSRLVSRLQQSGIFSDSSWKVLPDMMLAIRFAWLSEWLRKNDQPMIRLEADYMELLLDHSSTIEIPSFLIPSKTGS